MSDLAERLRRASMTAGMYGVCHDAADEIERLLARVEEAVECCTIKDNRILRLETDNERLRARLAEAERLLRDAVTPSIQWDKVADRINAFLKTADSASASAAPAPDSTAAAR